MKVIFLDIDDVLNHTATYIELSETWFKDMDNEEAEFNYSNPLCLKCVENLNKLIEATDAYIVISSTWRLHECLQPGICKESLERRGFRYNDRILGFTPITFKKTRGVEIWMWLNRHPEVTKFIILDDSEHDTEPYFPGKLVHVKIINEIEDTFTEEEISQDLNHGGFNDFYLKQAIELLNKGEQI